MVSLDRNLVSDYVNSKVSKNISETLKDKIIVSISNDGKISESEVQELEQIINTESKNDSKLKQDYINIVNKVLNKTSNKFDPKNLEFTVENKNLTIKDSSINLALPKLVTTTFKSGITDGEKNTSLKNINAKSGNIFTKSMSDIEKKISEINSRLSKIDKNDPIFERLNHIKSTYTSIKNLYLDFSKPFNPGDSQLKKITNNIKSAYEKIKELPNYMYDNELAENSKNLLDMQKTVSGFNNIVNAFKVYGGKIESSSNKLNEFAVQTFARLGDPNRDITKNIESAAKSFGLDISDMKIFNDRFSQLLKKVENGGFKNSAEAIAAFRAAAPKTSNKFLESIGNIGSSAQKQHEAEVEIRNSEKEINSAQQNITKGNQSVEEGNKYADSAKTNIDNSKTELSNQNLYVSREKISQAQTDNNNASQSSNNARIFANNAENNISSAKTGSKNSKNKLTSARTDLAKVSSEYSKSLSPTTGKVSNKISKTDKKIKEVDNNINKAEKDLSELKQKNDNLDLKINENNNQITDVNNGVNDLKNSRDTIKGTPLSNEDKQFIDNLKNSSDPETKALLDNMGDMLIAKTGDGKRVIDYIKDIVNTDKQINFDKNKLVNSILKNIDNINNVYQGPHGTCGAASFETLLITKSPADFVKIVTELALNGETKLKDGSSLSLSYQDRKLLSEGETVHKVSDLWSPPENPQTENRSPADMIFQSAVMNRVVLNPSLVGYSSRLDRSDIYGVIMGNSAANPYKIAKLMESVTGEDYDVNLSTNFMRNITERVNPAAPNLAPTISEFTGITHSQEDLEDKVRKSIANNKKVILTLMSSGGGGHYVTIVDVQKDKDNNEFALIKDSNRQDGLTKVPMKDLFSRDGVNISGGNIDYGKSYYALDVIAPK